MANQEQERKLILDSSLTSAVEKTIDEMDRLDIDYYSDEGITKEPKINIRKTFNQGGLNNLVDLKSQGSPIPGQSLTNSPDTPYPWEQPAQFSRPHAAIDYILATLMTKEGLTSVTQSIKGGASLVDLTSVILYSGFTAGKWSPDLMLILTEPTIYILMAIAERLDFEYVIDSDEEKETIPDSEVSKVLREESSKPEILNVMEEKIKSSDMSADNIPQSILQKVDQAIKKNNSLLGR